MPPKAEKKNNGFDRLRADLKAQTPQNVYLFYGEETYLRSYYLEELHRLLIPAGFEEFNYHRLSGKGLTVQELAEVTEAMPMMAQHTMVVVTDLDIFRLDEQQRTALHAKLESLTGKTIDLKTKVDAKVLGGIRLDIEGTELDGTVQNRLAALRRDIASVTL